MIQIVTGNARPVFQQIIDGVRIKVAKGELQPGDKLPSTRGLAMLLTINPNTVAKAYATLTAEGLIESRKGVGVFICEQRQRLSDDERRRRLDTAIETFVTEVVSLSFEPNDILFHLEAKLRPLFQNNDLE